MIEVYEKEKRQDPRRQDPSILVVGVGGGGCNAVNRMVASQNKNDEVTFAAVNTDIQVLNQSNAQYLLQIGGKLTNGFGAGADPSLGEASARESKEDLEAIVKSYDLVLVTCGMGGGTGTGAAPVIAELAKESGALTIAVVTLPFSFEGRPRFNAAKAGVEILKEKVDTLLVIPNDKLLSLSSKPFYLEEAFQVADTVLKNTIEGITNIIYGNGLINLDFNDLRATLANKGLAHLGIGTVPVDASVLEAVKAAVESPLLDTTIRGASNLLINTSGRVNLLELNEAIHYLHEFVQEDECNIIWGTVGDPAKEEIVVTLIATGIDEKKEAEVEPVLKQPVFPLSPINPLAEPIKPVRKEEVNIVIPKFLTNRIDR